MTKLYIIRHAEAEGNLYRRGHGHYDSSITRRGHLQIAALAERFRDVPIDALYTSDLRRTVTTASAITKYHALEMHKTPKLREICMGAWEDVSWGNLERIAPEQMIYFSTDPDRWEVEGGERFPDLAQRILSAVTEIVQNHPDQTVAIVTHGMAIRTLICTIMGVPSHEAHTVQHADNTSVTELLYHDGALELGFYNDNSHLTPELSTFAQQKWWQNKNGSDKKNLWFRPLSLEDEKELYLSCYADAWLQSHGSLDGFTPEIYYQRALAHAKNMPDALMCTMMDDAVSGLIELDPKRGADSDIGWITLCYLKEPYRGRRLAAQLIGHAVSVYRRLNRSAMRLHVAERNQTAISVYDRYGFEVIGEDPHATSRLLLMEKAL